MEEVEVSADGLHVLDSIRILISEVGVNYRLLLNQKNMSGWIIWPGTIAIISDSFADSFETRVHNSLLSIGQNSKRIVNFCELKI